MTQDNHVTLLPEDYDGIREGEDMPKKYEVTDITNIDSNLLTNAKCGDEFIKITGKQKHTYVVTYKGDGVGEGICMSYCACGYSETVSYDFTADGWVYNSTDKWEAEQLKPFLSRF